MTSEPPSAERPASRTDAPPRLDYEQARSAEPAGFIAAARALLVIGIKSLGFLLLVWGLWGALDRFWDGFLALRRGSAVYLAGTPSWQRSLSYAFLTYAVECVLGVILIVLADYVVPWLLPRRR